MSISLRQLFILGLTTVSTCVNGQSELPPERLNDGCITARNRRIDRIADSLNLWNPKFKLPAFILNPNLDQHSFFYYPCLKVAEPISTRKAILDRVYNPLVLKAIIESSNKELDDLIDWNRIEKEARRDFKRRARASQFPDEIPFRKFTTRYLAGKRLDDVQNMTRSHNANLGCWSNFDSTIAAYSDSLNYWKNVSGFPEFLKQDGFDESKKGILVNCLLEQELISYRKLIFDRVVNEDLLREISESTDLSLNDYVISTKLGPAIPYSKFSNKDLARMRLDRLSNMKTWFLKQ